MREKFSDNWKNCKLPVMKEAIRRPNLTSNETVLIENTIPVDGPKLFK